MHLYIYIPRSTTLRTCAKSVGSVPGSSSASETLETKMKTMTTTSKAGVSTNLSAARRRRKRLKKKQIGRHDYINVSRYRSTHTRR